MNASELILWGRAVDRQAEQQRRLNMEVRSALNREIRGNLVRRVIAAFKLSDQGFTWEG